MEMPEGMTSERRTPLYEAYHSNRYERQALISQYQEQYGCSLIILSDLAHRESTWGWYTV